MVEWVIYWDNYGTGRWEVDGYRGSFEVCNQSGKFCTQSGVICNQSGVIYNQSGEICKQSGSGSVCSIRYQRVILSSADPTWVYHTCTNGLDGALTEGVTIIFVGGAWGFTAYLGVNFLDY